MRKIVDCGKSLARRWGIQPGQMLRTWFPVACLVAVVATMFWYLCLRSERIHFLPWDRRAEWILYPTVPNLTIHPDGPLRAVFRRRFTVDSPVGEARLAIRGFKQFTVVLNGVEVAGSDSSRSWKAPSIRRLSDELFKVGENELVATASCERGPPALWLMLELNRGERIVSDEQWQVSLLGAPSEPARSAAVVAPFGKGTAPAESENPRSSFSKVWPVCLVFAVLAAATVGFIPFAWQRLGRREAAHRWAPVMLAATFAVAWSAILLWNWHWLRFPMGYDNPLHVEYIDYISRNHYLPLGNEGMEMSQPPLYYLLASLISPPPLSQVDAVARVFNLRAMSWVASVVQLLLLAGCLRLVFPKSIVPQAVGLFLAGCLPTQLYLMHNISNDVLAGALSTASVYMALVVIRQRTVQLKQAAVFGICLGAAILSKLSAMPVVLAVLMVSFWQLLARSQRIGQWVVRLLVPALACVLVCGWYFARNYVNFRALLPPDQSGFDYWQDPGYAMAAQFVRFGQSLSQPFFSSFGGIPDGIYSTLWGDGGWGGVTSRHGRPPWNYDLMAVGYLLALVPTILIAVGGLSCIWQVTRRWRPEKLLCLGIFAASICAVAYFYLQHPMHGTVKAFYALPSIAAVCIFAADGFLVLAGNAAWRRWVLGTALGAWGLTALTSFVVDRSSVQTPLWIAWQFVVAGDTARALTLLETAGHEHPDGPQLCAATGLILQYAGREDEARAELLAAVEADPDDAESRLALARAMASAGRTDDELRYLDEGLRLAPDQPDGYLLLVSAHLRNGDDAEAANAARAGLRVAPSQLSLHTVLAQTASRLGHPEEAIEHYRIILEWEPSQLPALTRLAAIYAMCPDRQLRDPALALEMATEASRLSGHLDPEVEDLLAAVYAAAGRFAEAEKILQTALEHGGPQDLLDRLQDHLAHIRSGEPLPGSVFGVGEGPHHE
ncbi:MAG TPA: tetratricopeptide repeat protein [Pirellulales bacterium]|nr:tetratricopeptide repeat protein [Pirellulales bacterium]